MKILGSAAANRVTERFLEGLEPLEVEGLVNETGRAVDTSRLRVLTDAAKERFDGDPPASDAWLAGRLHCLLRLTRREASEKGFWLYLAYVEVPDYVLWRWSKSPAPRFNANDVNQALSRLWWAAELFRVGRDYTRVDGAFSPPDVVNTIMRLQAAHNRPFCDALLHFVAGRRTDGKRLIGRQVNNLSTAVNSQLFVAALDAIAPDAGDDSAAQAAWRSEAVPPEHLLDGDRRGPDDLNDPLYETKVSRVYGLLQHIADGARIATAEDPSLGSERPSDLRGVEDGEDDLDTEDSDDSDVRDEQ